MFLEIVNNTSESEHAGQQLGSALQAEWEAVDKEVFDTLGATMGHRIEAYIKAKGWHTKYFGQFVANFGHLSSEVGAVVAAKLGLGKKEGTTCGSAQYFED
jgi:hypothetical protein